MPVPSSCILLFDHSAILASDIHFWRGVSRLGECMVHRSVIEEMKHIARTAAGSRNPDQDPRKALDFLRFLRQSSWKVTDLMQVHEDLERLPNHAIARKSRMSLAIAQCAYGTANLNRDVLIVLVTNEPSLLKRINDLGVDNLCAATFIGVRQWMRTKSAPAAISSAIAAIKAGKLRPVMSTTVIQAPLEDSTVIQTEARSPNDPGDPDSSTNTSIHANTTNTNAANTNLRVKTTGKMNPNASTQRNQSHSVSFSKIVSGLIGWTLVLACFLGALRILQPEQFDQIWQKIGLPDIPNLLSK